MTTPPEPTPLFPKPEFTWRLTPADDGTLTIETINRYGNPDAELWCTVEQALQLGSILTSEYGQG